MKKGCGLIALALLLAAAPAFAQNPTIGVYFDPQGRSTFEPAHLTPFPTYTAYVIAFFENVVGGAAYKITMDPGFLVTQEVFPAGIQIGTCTTGCEIGLTVPQFGFYHEPVLLETLTIMGFDDRYGSTRISVGPWEGRYETVLLSDHLGTLYPADGLESWIWCTVGTESATWGSVKSLYR